MINPDDTSLVMINYSTEFFRHTFSKMEFLMGMDYMNSFISKYNIPVIFTKREICYNVSNPDLNVIHNLKEKNRKKNMPPESDYDENFIKEFNNKIAVKNEIKVQKEDIFYQSNIENVLKDTERKTVLFGGFLTDTDVFISSINAGMREYRSIVVSDISSTYSERLYFQSLEMISQFIDVIDTRDLGEDFPL
ncbi:MAG: isochorismatase family protein [Ferroplasma sp.]|uniref:isochorismatase family protein n=1 Tax=Ferroplasma sp. TaxID=2591003 RepID=UPI002814CA16|nr:isochorismatase family protein [Ferroplasma sp.]WMT51461.1 MAG: isochorismatase family protein [Ferroplasma sp.]